MKCEHGQQITVEIDWVDKQYADDGFRDYNSDGSLCPCAMTDIEGGYLRVIGCPHCKVIKYEDV